MTRPSKPETPDPLKGGDYASGWWGEEEARRGERPPGPYGQPPEVDPDAPDVKKPGRPPK